MFVAFLAEMRHPMDFWKGMMCAQLFIGIVYVFFGTFVSYWMKVQKQKFLSDQSLPSRSTANMANIPFPTLEM